ncbi:putative RNA-binding protein [Encephalitozoon hellem ATCC 50504]|nr:putative RNA-binding protein [Encephalitozoon hellem ATCC 50504]AFM99337.1 putative RNA-binding protein [Encephalitozoon hellem ATCC 50504]UTX44341.1 pre-rRNA-processing protein PNO1 [Encephalitozoon hellem]|eukprot:XP_003888318.1 putative RNA-binding protein [Encephalitozoon hellem ATCC 50504]
MIEIQTRSIPIHPKKMRMMKEEWMKIYTPIVEICKIQIRMNIKGRCVEMRTCEHTEDPSYLERSAQYIEAVSIGFPIDDAIAILKFSDVFLDRFEISEVKTLRGHHVERAVGRIIGREGKTKDAIEEFSRSKIIVQEQMIHFLGTIENIRIAKDAVCRLIMGSQPGSIFNRLRIINSRLKEKYGGIQTIYNEFEKR